jgi:tetratricopeptide (TPR) repeat protein
MAELAAVQAARPGHPLAVALGWAGSYLQVRARFADAKALLELALVIDEAAYGPDHPEVATDLNNLATILQDLGQPEAARPLQERALAIDEAVRAARFGSPGGAAGK